MKNYKIGLAVLIVIISLGLAYTLNKTDKNIQLHQVDIRTKQAEINTLNEQIDEYEESDKKDDEKLESLKTENERLQSELQAKLDRQAQDARNAVLAVSVKPVSKPAPTGSCKDWIVQAGVSDVANAYALIMVESGCNPAVFNPTSGAGGIPQALPFSKMGCSTSEPVCQIQWMQRYVDARYNGFANAYAFWQANNWY